MKADILLVSNGFGEAAIVGYIAKAIAQRAPETQVAHFPLVGVLAPGSWPSPVGPQQNMPSGGLVTNWNVGQLIRDLRAGLGGLTLRQSRFLASQKRRDAIVAVGDIYCLAQCATFARRPVIFVATAKSQYVAPHSALECAIARAAAVTFARDAQTAAALRQRGARARYAGNVMMDGLRPAGADLGVSAQALRIGVMPGSRGDAVRNAELMTRRVLALGDLLAPRSQKLQAFISVAPNVDAVAISAAAAKGGVGLQPIPDGPVAARGVRANVELVVVRDAFADLVNAVELVFGQAGTANEQAAGLGRPVIAAAEPGEAAPERMHWYRMRQKRLLGDALLVLAAEPGAFARGVLALLDDPDRMARMAATGRQRMGAPGGADAIAQAALELVAAQQPQPKGAA